MKYKVEFLSPKGRGIVFLTGSTEIHVREKFVWSIPGGKILEITEITEP